MNNLRGFLRLLHLLAHFFNGLYLSYTRLHGTQSHDLSEEQHKIIQNWLHRSAEIIGIDIQIHGTPHQAPVFIVANHISWLDIIIISSVLPVSFLSKAEIRSWPIIGTLAAKAGTLFIKRGSRNGAAEAIELMQTKRLSRKLKQPMAHLYIDFMRAYLLQPLIVICQYNPWHCATLHWNNKPLLMSIQLFPM